MNIVEEMVDRFISRRAWKVAITKCVKENVCNNKILSLEIKDNNDGTYSYFVDKELMKRITKS